MVCEGESDERDPTLVSKLMQRPTAKRELAEGRLIAQLDPIHMFTIVPTSMCTPAAIADRHTDNIKECKYLFPSRAERSYFRHNRGAYALLQIQKANGDLFSLLKRTSNAPSPYAFFAGFVSLFKGLAMVFENNGLVHYDIKPENIVYNVEREGQYRFRFIDFGLMVNLNQPAPWTRAAAMQGYFIWPICNYLVHSNHITSKQWSQYDDDAYSRLYAIVPSCLLHVKNKDGYEVGRYLNDDLLRQLETERDPALYLAKTDVYSLGITLAMAIRKYYDKYELWDGQVHIDGNAVDEVNETTESFKHLMTLALQMTEPIPRNRPSAETAMQTYMAIMRLLHRFYVKKKVPFEAIAILVPEVPSPVRPKATATRSIKSRSKSKSKSRSRNKSKNRHSIARSATRRRRMSALVSVGLLPPRSSRRRRPSSF
jgi:serine/threonine protein kinase